MEKIIKFLKEAGVIKRKEVEEALKKIPRKEFLPESMKNYAEIDTPIPIGHGQTTSAVHMTALLCEITELKQDETVLEIGAGSGYMASIYNSITKSEIFTIEIIKDLAKFAKKNIKKQGLDWLIHVVNADCTYSLPFRNKFDVIIVTACSKDIPDEYIKKLNENGRLIIPVGSYEFSQELFLVKKIKNKIFMKKITECAFVPLTGTNKLFKES